MSGKGYVTLAILASTISEKSNRNQSCKSTNCQSKNMCNFPDKETMITWVSTRNDWLRFPIRSFFIYLQRSVRLKSIFRPMVALKSTISLILPAMQRSLGNNMAAWTMWPDFFQTAHLYSIYKGTLGAVYHFCIGCYVCYWRLLVEPFHFPLKGRPNHH